MTRLPAFADRRPEPVLVVVAALLAAAILVVYLQHRAITSLRHEAEMVVRGVSESAASQLAATIQRTLSGPVEALGSVNQPELSAGRIDLVADAFHHGFTEYPQVARFFLWHRLSDAIAPNEVVFFDRDADARRSAATGGGEPSDLTSFSRDAAIGGGALSPGARAHGAAELRRPRARHGQRPLPQRDSRLLGQPAPRDAVHRPRVHGQCRRCARGVRVRPSVAAVVGDGDVPPPVLSGWDTGAHGARASLPSLECRRRAVRRSAVGLLGDAGLLAGRCVDRAHRAG